MEQGGDLNMIFLNTDTPIPDNVVEALRALPMVESVTPLEFPAQMPSYVPSSCNR